VVGQDWGSGCGTTPSARATRQSGYQLARVSIVSLPRLSSVTETGLPHSGQRMAPRDMRAAKIMSSNVSPSPRAYEGPSSVMRSITSVAGVSGSAAKQQKQLGQDNSICMAYLSLCEGEMHERLEQLQARYQFAS